MTQVITLVLADDHAVVRSGLKLLLESEADLEVLGEAADAEEALRKVKAHRPNVLLLDIVMPGRSPIEVIPEVTSASPQTRIVVLTMQSDPAYAKEALRVGASGYLLKEGADTELVDAVRQVASGSIYLYPALGARLAREDGDKGDEGSAVLSQREAEIFELLALGHTNQEIADKLYLSVRTVESHRAHIHQKLGLNSRAELVRYALDHGLLASDS